MYEGSETLLAQILVEAQKIITTHLSGGYDFFVSSAKTKPPVLPGEIKSFSENKTAELDARRMYWRKNNLQV